MKAAGRRVPNSARRIGVVEYDLHAAGQARQFAERRERRLRGQIRRDAEPQHERPLARVEPACFKRRGHASVLEVMGDVGHMRRLGDLSLGEAAALVALGRRMVELEEAQPLGRLKAIGEGVEARAKHEDLPHAPVDGPAGRVLGEATAHRDEETQGPPLRLFLGERDRIVGVCSQDTKRERVGEYDPALENLMRRSVPRRADGGAARLSLLHASKVEGGCLPVEPDELDGEKPYPYRPAPCRRGR